MAAAVVAINSYSVVDMEYSAEDNITCLQNGTNSSCSPNKAEAVISRLAPHLSICNSGPQDRTHNSWPFSPTDERRLLNVSFMLTLQVKCITLSERSWKTVLENGVRSWCIFVWGHFCVGKMWGNIPSFVGKLELWGKFLSLSVSLDFQLDGS